MSSRPADPGPGGVPPRPAWSLATRLILLYTLTTGTVLVLCAGGLYREFRANLARDDQAQVLDTVGMIATILRGRAGDIEFLRHEVESELPAQRFQKNYARVRGPGGVTLAETPGIGSLGADGVLAELEGPGLGIPTAWRAAAGEQYLLVADRIDGYRVEVVLDVEHKRPLLSAYANVLGAMVATGLLVSAALGVLVTRRALAPLDAIGRTAREVTAARLSRRIAAEGWPSELTELAESFDAMLGRLEESFGRISAFSADLAHELRTPLSNLRGEIEVALSKPRTEQEYRDLLGSNLEELHRLGALVDSMLFLARAEAPDAALEKKPLRLEDEVRAVLEYYEPLAAEKAIVLELAGSAEAAADSGLLRRALGNLVANALKFSAGGGRIRVTIARAGGEARIEVADQGPGIPAADLARLGERFFRVDRSRRQGPGGSGLGLAITRTIATLHRGRLEIESQVGRGTVARLVLPA